MVTDPEVLWQEGRGVATSEWGLAGQEGQGEDLKASFTIHRLIVGGNNTFRSLFDRIGS